MTWVNKLWKFNTTPTAVNMTALQADITAKNNGDVGAPPNILASMASGSVDSSQIVAAAVTQSKLDTAIGEKSFSFSSVSHRPNIVMDGGEYAFYPQVRVEHADLVGGFVIGSELDDVPPLGFTNVTYKTNLAFYPSSVSGTRTMYAQMRYVQASPPYDLGDGVCHLFTFCLIEDATGNIVGVSSAPDAPWHNNGPTDIKAHRLKHLLIKLDEDKVVYDHRELKHDADIVRDLIARDIQPTAEQLATLRAWIDAVSTLEYISVNETVPQSVKNADMALIPHPFAAVPPGHTVVLLDPISELSAQLFQLQQNENQSVCAMLMNGFFVLNPNELARISPPGVKTISYRWK